MYIVSIPTHALHWAEFGQSVLKGLGFEPLVKGTNLWLVFDSENEQMDTYQRLVNLGYYPSMIGL